jgi:arylsulfatase A-like enzyme
MTEDDLSDKPRFLREQAPRLREMGPDPAAVRLAQLRLLQSVDELVGSLDRELRRARESEDTLVLFTSDNGLHWGEHGGLITKDLPYDASTHVPLMIRWPASAGRRPGVDRRLVSNVDIAPTILDVAVAKGHKPDGRSLRNRGWRRDFLLLEHGGFRSPDVVIPPWIALRDRGRLYVEWGPGVPWGEQAPAYPPETEYYAVRRDPWELQSAPQATPPGLSAVLREAFRCRGARNCP